MREELNIWEPASVQDADLLDIMIGKEQADIVNLLQSVQGARKAMPNAADLQITVQEWDAANRDTEAHIRDAMESGTKALTAVETLIETASAELDADDPISPETAEDIRQRLLDQLAEVRSLLRQQEEQLDAAWREVPGDYVAP